MIGRVWLEPLDLDLHRQKIGIGLREDARRHEPTLGQKLQRARQNGRFGVGFETVSDSRGITLESEHGGHGPTPGKTDEQRQAGLQCKPGC